MAWRRFLVKSFSHSALVTASFITLLSVRDLRGENPPKPIENTIGMKLVTVPSGEFMMGTEEDRREILSFFSYCDPRTLSVESVRHKVRITKAFDIGQHEVTLGQFMEFCKEAEYKIEIERDGKPSLGSVDNGPLMEANTWRPWDPGWEIGMDHPAVYVSWNDAIAFCGWLSKKEGKVYRLPTEAEWEYACRAGSNSRYHFGNDPEELFRYANVADQDRRDGKNSMTITSFGTDGKETNTGVPYPFVSQHDGFKSTAPCGKFLPNAFGLYDMHGNAFEWCSDRFNENYYSKSPEADPQGPNAGLARLLRGGAFFSTPFGLRCASRSASGQSFRSYGTGFRVVCER